VKGQMGLCETDAAGGAIDLGFERRDLEAIFTVRMPFGRFDNRPLIDLPEEYLLWFERRGFPDGNLGRLMKLCLGIKRYGAEPAVKAVGARLRDCEGPEKKTPRRGGRSSRAESESGTLGSSRA